MAAGKQGRQMFTLEGDEHDYQVLIESMNEGARTQTVNETILNANPCFARMVKSDLTIAKKLETQVREGHGDSKMRQAERSPKLDRKK